MDDPKISVIMSVYNGERYLKQAIESILNQTFTDFELIIVNDGSTDNSLKIIQSYDDTRIRLINNKANIGLTKSLNKAIKQAHGKYIARQDADDISLHNRFEEQLRYFERYLNVALLGTSVYLIDENGKTLGKRIALTNPGKQLLKENQFNHGSTMFKKEAVVRLGEYNELLRYSQDYELWLRMAKHYEVRNLARALYKLRFHGEVVTFKHAGESALYHLLALRLARNNFDEKLLETINNNGIKGLYYHLNGNEKVLFHKLVANMLVKGKYIKRAREEYKTAFRLNHFNIKNTLNLLLSYLGENTLYQSHKTYTTIKNFLWYLKNFAFK